MVPQPDEAGVAPPSSRSQHKPPTGHPIGRVPTPTEGGPMPDKYGFDHLPHWGETHHRCVEEGCGWPGFSVRVSEADRARHARQQDLMPKEARSRYFQRRNGPMFVWTTEPFNLMYGRDKDPAQGKFESVVYRPIGKGSRSGKASQWQRDEGTARLHVLAQDMESRRPFVSLRS